MKIILMLRLTSIFWLELYFYKKDIHNLVEAATCDGIIFVHKISMPQLVYLTYIQNFTFYCTESFQIRFLYNLHHYSAY